MPTITSSHVVNSCVEHSIEAVPSPVYTGLGLMQSLGFRWQCIRGSDAFRAVPDSFRPLLAASQIWTLRRHLLTMIYWKILQGLQCIYEGISDKGLTCRGNAEDKLTKKYMLQVTTTEQIFEGDLQLAQ